RAILLFGKAYRFFDCRGIDFVTGDDVVDADRGKHLGRPISLVRLHAHRVTGPLLVELLAKDGDDIECGAAGQADGDEFDGLGAVPPTGSSSRIWCSLPVKAMNWRSIFSG